MICCVSPPIRLWEGYLRSFRRGRGRGVAVAWQADEEEGGKGGVTAPLREGRKEKREKRGETGILCAFLELPHFLYHNPSVFGSLVRKRRLVNRRSVWRKGKRPG